MSGEIVFLVAVFLFVPIGLARVLFRAEWRMILKAYSIWVGLLVLSFAAMTGNTAETIGWSLIFGMFYTIPAILVLVPVLKGICWLKRVNRSSYG